MKPGLIKHLLIDHPVPTEQQEELLQMLRTLLPLVWYMACATKARPLRRRKPVS